MSRPLPRIGGRERPANTVALLREAFVTLNDRAIARLAERGHEAVRPAHGAVFQHLDDTGTPVARLAERARMTKQAMAELVAHLEQHGYVVREPDPGDRRAKLVIPTERGLEVFAVVQELVPEIERDIDELLGSERADALRADLDRLRGGGDTAVSEGGCS
jgi:DNA-binding MarR family transcriptional regulator